MNEENHSLQHLATEYYLRELTPSELTELQKGLKHDPELRDFFMETASEEWLMHHAHQTQINKLIPFAPRRSRRSSLQRIAAIALFALTLGGLFYAYRPAPELAAVATIVSESPAIATVTDCFILPNDAISVVNNGAARSIKEASLLHHGDRVDVPPGSRMTFQYLNEKTTVQMSGGSFFTLSDQNGAKQIHLQMGLISAEVDKQASDKPMRITTDDAEAVVLGTSFELLAGNVTRLAVESGCVQFNSSDAHQSIAVESGYLAESTGDEPWASRPYHVDTLYPSADETLGRKKYPHFISVDFVRNYRGYITFDLGENKAPIIEAKLRLRVMQKRSEKGGHGTIRLYAHPHTTSPKDPSEYTNNQLARYTGKVGAGMDLEFDVNPAKLSIGMNRLVITQDEGGNDFWFSSSEGDFPPQLILKREEEKCNESNM